ncbi:MAG: PQQ-binding-like beta-propeller repeat protein [Planctomycetales bacterium]
MACLDASTGRQIWSVEVKQKFRGKGSDFGFAITPTVVEGLVILPVGGLGASVVALHCRDGSIAWNSGGESASYTPVLPIRVRGERQLLALMENSVAAYEFPKGSQLWRIGLSQGYDEHSAWPVYSEPYFFISSPFRSGGELYQLSDKKLDPPRLVRHTDLMSNDIFSCALAEGHLYGFDLKDVQAKAHRPSRGTFRCLEFPSLKEKWSTDRTGHANVIVADGKLILFNDEGDLILAKQTPARYEELARARVLGGEICWTQPTLSHGRLYVRNHSRCACILLGEKAPSTAGPGKKLLTVKDIPQSWSTNMVGLLGVEPEYAFDVPSREWLWNWFWLSLGAVLLPAAFFGLITARFVSRGNAMFTLGLFWTIAFLLGAIGTTALSLWRQEFTFTWPVCMFIALQGGVFGSTGRAEPKNWRQRWNGWLIVAWLAATCLLYFFLCRRLSLLTEWVFLVALPAGVPLSILARQAIRTGQGPARAIGWTLLSFAAYYWAAVGILALRY